MLLPKFIRTNKYYNLVIHYINYLKYLYQTKYIIIYMLNYILFKIYSLILF